MLILSIKERIKSLLKTGKYSELFYDEFYNAIKNGYKEFDFVAREILYLEGARNNTTTKKEMMFRGDVLKGLWKKHVMVLKICL